MRVLVVAFLIGLVTVPAHAQDGMIMPGFKLNDSKEYSEEEKEKMRANEAAAKAARAKLPDAKTSSDPWANARSAETPAPKKPKTPAKQ